MSTLQAAASQTEGESRDWLHDLRRPDRTGEEAVTRLHALLLGAARFEIARRGAKLPLEPDEAAALALEAADDAVLQVRAHLGDFGDGRRFTTWARKFAILEAAVRVRRLMWERHGPTLEPDDAGSDSSELVRAVEAAVTDVLTPVERRVLLSLAVNGAPIDVLARRLHRTRGELYETVQEARGKLRRDLANRGLSLN